MKKPPVVFGTCCVCGYPCVKGERITVGAPDCLIRHTDCQQKRVDRRVSER